MLSNAQIEEFHLVGFVDGGRILNDEQVDELRQELDRVIETSRRGFRPDEPKPVVVRNLREEANPVLQVVNIWQASAAFERLIYDRGIVEPIGQLAGVDELFLYHDQVVYKPPRHGGVVQWHQDAPYWGEMTPTTPVSAWVALDDVDEENGAMWMVPGSHQWGDVTWDYLQKLKPENFHRPDAEGFVLPEGAPTREVKPTLRPVCKGGVHFHHSWMWHASHANRSDRPRRAVAIHYVIGDARFHRVPKGPMQELTTAPDGSSVRDLGSAFPCVYHAGKIAGIARQR